MENKTPKGKYFIHCVNEYESGKVAKMGYMSNFAYWHQPIRLCLTAARYKFVSKMFAGFSEVLELGCADAFYSAIVADTVGHLVCSDYDPVFIDQAKKLGRLENMEMRMLDLSKEPCTGQFAGIYALDVFEHIHPKDEDEFMKNCIRALKRPTNNASNLKAAAPNERERERERERETASRYECENIGADSIESYEQSEAGVLILGIPSLESQVYASEGSKAEHVNCKSGEDFKAFCKKYFNNVFVFSMNDEVVHTGFYPMAHYLFALCTYPKEL